MTKKATWLRKPHRGKEKIVRRKHTRADVKKLRAHSARTPLAKIMKRRKNGRPVALKALKLGIGLAINDNSTVPQPEFQQ